MYSLQSTNAGVKHFCHSIVAMGFKEDKSSEIYKKYKGTKNCKKDEKGKVIIIKTFDSSGSSYKKNHEGSMGRDNEVFIYSQKEGGVT